MPFDQEPTTATPPPHYRLDEVRITLQHQPGRGPFPLQRLTLPGNGNATLERAGTRHSFQYGSGAMMRLLNELYRMRFFDLPEDCTARPSVFLKDDGTVATSTLKLADAPSTKVCFATGGYRKCVTYAQGNLAELDQIVQRVFTDSERLAREP